MGQYSSTLIESEVKITHSSRLIVPSWIKEEGRESSQGIISVRNGFGLMASSQLIRNPIRPTNSTSNGRHSSRFQQLFSCPTAMLCLHHLTEFSLAKSTGAALNPSFAAEELIGGGLASTRLHQIPPLTSTLSSTWKGAGVGVVTLTPLVVRSGSRKRRHNNHSWGIRPTGGDSMQPEKQPTQ